MEYKSKIKSWVDLKKYKEEFHPQSFKQDSWVSSLSKDNYEVDRKIRSKKNSLPPNSRPSSVHPSSKVWKGEEWIYSKNLLRSLMVRNASNVKVMVTSKLNALMKRLWLSRRLKSLIKSKSMVKRIQWGACSYWSWVKENYLWQIEPFKLKSVQKEEVVQHQREVATHQEKKIYAFWMKENYGMKKNWFPFGHKIRKSKFRP